MRGYRLSRPPLSGDNDPRLGGGPFNKGSFGLETHRSPYDNGTVQVGKDGIEVVLMQGIDEPSMARVLSAAEHATIGLELDDLHKIASMNPDEASEMFKGGLQTALETQVLVFAVRGVSRTCTHQLVRTRKASFHQQSQRASYMGNFPEVRMPETVARAPAPVRGAWLRAFDACARAYHMAKTAGVPYQDARFILPEGTTTFIMCEYPVREFLAVYSYRACYMFQWEISVVMAKMREVLIADHPWIEPYVKITCERSHVCEFQGWERVEGHCPLPWAREDNRRFKSERHEIKQV